MADKQIGPGTVLAARYRLEDLLQEAGGAKFWRATDRTLARNVAVHVIEAQDPRAEALLVAARTSATVTDGHFLRVLDAAREDGVVYVVNEWGTGASLDIMLAEGPLAPRRAAWVVKEVADAITTAHAQGVAHGRLLPENVMVTEAGSVKLIGFVIDAVLHGRHHPREPGGEPLSDHESDVLNLGALLYATLVGKWPGSAGSALPAAPREHGHPLRPRQVRAGVPRPLDAICDRVLNPQVHEHTIPTGTAQEIGAALSDFIGDPTGSYTGYEPTTVLEVEQVRSLWGEPPAETAGSEVPAPEPHPEPEPTRAEPAQEREQRPSSTAKQAATAAWGPAAAEAPETADLVRPPDPEPHRHAEAASEPEAEHHSGPDPEATQAGTPVFFDEDPTVGWVSAEPGGALPDAEPPGRRPPPPLPDPEPRPLFAPGSRALPPRDPSLAGETRTQVARRYTPTSARSAGGTGSLPRTWGPDAEAPADEDGSRGVPATVGSGWLRLAGILALCLVLLIAIIVAFNLGRGSGDDTASPDTTPSPGASAISDKPLKIAAVTDLDPAGDPPEENPQLARLAADGDPTTAWRTMTYFNNPALGGLKDGVGLVLDLGDPVQVSKARITLIGQPTSLDLYAADQDSGRPTSVTGLTKVASSADAGTTVDLDLRRPVKTRYLVVWLTSLPPGGGGYVGQVAEVVVRS